MEKMGRDDGNKRQRFYRCGYSYVLSKLIVDNRLKDLWRGDNPGFSVFTRCDRSSDTKSRMNRVYIDTTIANNTKINHIIVFFSDNYNPFSKKRNSSQKLKLGKTKSTLIIHFQVIRSSSQLQKIYFFIKNSKKSTLLQVTGGSTPIQASIQENIRISRLKERLQMLK